MTLQVQFWGVRGSMATPGKDTLRTGGNTSCVEVRNDHGGRLLFDAGSGLRVFGNQLDDDDDEVTILLSHYHWDHLLGFPVFNRMFKASSTIHIYGERTAEGDAKTALMAQFSTPHFPVPFEDISADLKFHPVKPGDELDIQGFKVKTLRLNHPNLAVGFRVECDGKSVVYATDHEHDDAAAHQALEDFARGANVLIYDSTYDDANYSQFAGWGHSTWQECLRLAERASVERPVIFHHDPERDDGIAHAIEQEAQKMNPKAVLAREGLILDV